MRCPECHANNEAGAAACMNCGLLLFKAQPQRRAEDFAVQKRRESDRDNAVCQYCGGEIASSAIRCRHCSEIVNDQFYRERARRVRSRVNYASWIAYLFGLGALLLFRPVGLLSIAAGQRPYSAYNGMSVSAHYEYWIVPSVVVYDLRGVSFRQTPIDVHTALLEFAKKLKAKRYSKIELSYRGVTKYSIDGAAFQRLGVEYAKRNFQFVLYQFPRLFHSVGPPEKDPSAAGARD